MRVWGVAIALMVAVQLLVLFLVWHRHNDDRSARGAADGATTTTLPGPLGGGPVDEGAVPGVGGDVFLAGGIARVPVLEGWRLLARGDRKDNPGGYSESAVLSNPQFGVGVGVYLQDVSSQSSDAMATADTAARSWTSDGKAAQVDPAEPLTPFGGVVGGASVRYRYTRSSALEGEAVVAVRGDGTTLLVVVDAGAGTFDAARPTWLPVRQAILDGFAASPTKKEEG